MEKIQAIDLWAPILPVPDMMRHAAENFPDEMLGYLRVFYKMRPTQEAVRERFRAFSLPEEEVIRAIDAAGITRSLITGFDERTSAGKTFMPNELVAGLAERHPGRFIPFAGIDVLEGMAGVRKLEEWVTRRAFKGLSLRPFMIGLPADHRR